MTIQTNIYRESPDVCRFALTIDGERAKLDDDRVKSYIKDKDWAAFDVKTLTSIVRSMVRMQSADLRTIAGMMVEPALADGRLVEAE